MAVHQACQGMEMGSAEGAAPCVTVSARGGRQPGMGSGGPGKEAACGPRQPASPWLVGWKADKKTHKITWFVVKGFDGIDRFQ